LARKAIRFSKSEWLRDGVIGLFINRLLIFPALEASSIRGMERLKQV
jgi:hypothetical protein